MSKISQISIIIFLFIVFGVTASAIADWKDNAKVTRISCGKDHTLILTQNKFPWCSGYNGYYQLGIGDTQDSQFTPVRVHKPVGSEYLDNETDVSAGSVFSLILDVNSSIWSFGDNVLGELGNNGYLSYQATPVLVHGINNSGYLKNITAISAARDGRHSLALDANSELNSG